MSNVMSLESASEALCSLSATKMFAVFSVIMSATVLLWYWKMIIAHARESRRGMLRRARNIGRHRERSRALLEKLRRELGQKGGGRG